MSKSIILNVYSFDGIEVDKYIGPFANAASRDKWLKENNFMLMPDETDLWKRKGDSFFVIANESSSVLMKDVYAHEIIINSASVATVENC